MMRKSCCIDDSNFTPKSSSCSMVLRSACSHGHHSHNSLTVEKSQNQDINLNKKFLRKSTAEKESCEKSGKIETYFHTSLKHFAYKSAKTYSVLKESLYSHLDYSRKLKNKSTNEKETSSESLGDLYSLSKSRGLFLNNNSINQEECCHINDNYITSNYTDMSKSRDFSRSSIAAVNALSDSENEESLSKGILKKRVSKRSLSSKSQSSSGKTESLSFNNHSNHNSASHSISVNNASHTTYETTVQGSYKADSNSNYCTPTSSILYRSNINHSQGSDVSSATASPLSPTVIDISNVQNTIIDRFRWFLWKSIYLKVIKCVNFDVWLLSRSYNYKKILALLLLIPFLIYLLLGTDSKNFTAFDELSSRVYDSPSYIYSSFSSLFMDRKHKSTVSEFSSEESSSCSQKAYDAVNAISLAPWYFFLSLYSKIKGSFTNNDKEDLKLTSLEIKRLKEDVKLMALEIKRLKDDATKMKDSNFKENLIVKDDSANKMLVSDITSLRLEFQSIAESIKKLEKEVSPESERSSKYAITVEDHNARIISMNSKMKSLEDKLSNLSIALKNCCDEKWTLSDFTASFEKYFLAALKTMVERDKDKTSPYYFFNQWLQTKLTTDKEILSQLKKEFTLKADLSSGDFSQDVVQQLIREAILLYDADKTGKVDYALESGGGSVLSTRCSESYAEKDGTISVLGLPIWSTHSSPRTVIQPGMQPGQCWAFKGSQGFLVIQLSYTIQVTGFTLEHIPLSLSPSGSIDSAPQNFSVWGLLSEKDNEGKLLGSYTFDMHGDSLQYFPVQNTHSEAFSFVELKILSNWGNLEYTCLYRFRVHGKQPKH